MIILGLKQNKNKVEAALVQDGKMFLASKTFATAKLPAALTEFIAEALKKKQNVAYVAFDESLEVNTDFIKAPSILVNAHAAKLYVNQLTDASSKDLNLDWKYPVLTLVDDDNETSILVVYSPTNIKTILRHKDQTLNQLRDKLAQVLQSRSLETLGAEGDAESFQFTFPETGLEQFDLNFLIQALEDKKKEFVAEQTNKELHATLQRYYYADLAAAVEKALFEGVVLAMFSLANELNIFSFSVTGNIAKYSRFLHMLSKEAQSDKINVYLKMIDSHEEQAAGIAGVAYHEVRPKN